MTVARQSLIIILMVAFERESKFRILRNCKALEADVPAIMASLGLSYNVKNACHVDVYLDFNGELHKSGYSLRQRFNGGMQERITLKTLETVDEGGRIRVEEEGATFKQVVDRVKKKLKSIYQDPADEKAIEVLSNPDKLWPVVILSKSRTDFVIESEGKVGALSIDAYVYLLPKPSETFWELEIEGGSFLEPLRELVIKKYAKGKNPVLGASHKSKFETGLTIGGAL